MSSSTNNSDACYLLALSQVQGIGTVLAKQLISHCGSVASVFNAKGFQLRKVPGIGQKLADNIERARALLPQASEQLSIAQKQSVTILSYLEEGYPYRLKHAIDAPLVLFYKGQANLNAQKTVAIVGTRKSTSYGQAITGQLVEGLKAYHDVLVVSGLAYGIDITAHRACLHHHIPTVAVQANGLGTVYPPLHQTSAEQMLAQGGGLISEYPFHTPPDAHRFPSRNRIIAGLADVVIVVEARKKGGALITADIANSYSREVCAIPGDLRKATSEGCHSLIKHNKAHLITSVEDLAYLMDWEKGQSRHRHGIQAFLALEDPAEKRICEVLRQGDLHIDLLCLQTQIPLNKLSGMLLQLEFQGLVRPQPGKIFGLIRKI